MIRRQEEGVAWAGDDGIRDGLTPLTRSARLILEVVPGERKLLPEFGCRVHLLPAIASDADRRLAAALIEEALEAWAPSLRVDRADVTSVEEGVIGLLLRARGAAHSLTITHRHPHRVDEKREVQAEVSRAAISAEDRRPEGQDGGWRGRSG